jgi:hypothetical protein
MEGKEAPEHRCTARVRTGLMNLQRGERADQTTKNPHRTRRRCGSII